MPKPQKIDAVNNIKKYLEEANSVFITDYSGLNVENITRLRKNLRENSIKYLIAKNTLIKIAAQNTGYENMVEFLSGPTAIAFGVDDPAVAARILYDSYKDVEKPVIRAFILDKEIFDGSEIVRLAELPPREVLLSQLIATVESPLSSLTSGIDGIFQELVATVDALAKSKG